MELPNHEGARKALKWISEQRRLEPELRLGEIIDRASRKFDLTPMEQEGLLTWLADQHRETD